ncbi:hypothetical protein N6H18_15120 [Reichenbachiella agarivorans]|uniref:4-vinyl reductase 4VR domain-containing protein n=1 Tax=Reichenbachiella agarivorans TaxID=2979464 RepID=A0ABY6CPI8_9BACT|nr:hypothetical protein [Reichenbachiella agarivorans]UXP31679.1 hypothetical protein N6H18_15120 [Reichenbachiella agarivorans]
MEISFDTYHQDKSVYYFANEPLNIQSEYLNLYLQKGIEEMGSKLNIVDLLVTTAQEITFTMFSKYFEGNEKMVKITARKKFVEDYYAHCGFGRINLTSIQPKGGYIEAVSEHFAMAWKRHFGLRPENQPGVSYFTLGFLCGAVEAIFDIVPGSFRGKQILCLSKGHGVCKFEIYRGLKRKINKSPGKGKLQHKVGEIEDVFVPNGSNVIEAINGLNLSGADSKKGLIDQFDMTLTKQFSNYMAMIEIKLLMQAKKRLGPQGIRIIKTFLEKLGEENTYFTVGKMLNSDYWQEYVESVVGKNPESRLYACLDVFTAFGCGRWQLVKMSTGQFKVSVLNNPETNSFLQLVGNTKSPLNFYAGGLMMGLANLLDKGAKTGNGVDLNFVNKLKKAGHHFEYVFEKSRMVGSEIDTLIVSRT